MKKKAIIIFSTKNGLTKNISNFIMNNLKENIATEIYSIERVENIVLSDYHIIILGSSIYYGKHNKKIKRLVEQNLELLTINKTAFFSVNVVARKRDKNKTSNNPYLIKFLKTTNWTPNLTAVFAGQVNYPAYSIFNKLVIRFIMFITKGPTNTEKCHNFTNWKNVSKFVEEIKLFI